ncbi:MAG: helix-turn-helix transcriptional regulator [Candidatus Rickettsiella isopodorum]|nr:helix-turn-helix transcriptional regulator [Candidatus Rickettsiella isopodorum]
MNETPGKRIRQARREADLTQAELGEKMHIHKISVSNLERNKYPPSYKTATKLSGILQKPISYFFGETETPTTKVSEPKVEYNTPVPELPNLVKLFIDLKKRMDIIESSLEDSHLKSAFNKDNVKKMQSKNIQLEAGYKMNRLEIQKLEKKITEFENKKKVLIEQMARGKRG